MLDIFYTRGHTRFIGSTPRNTVRMLNEKAQLTCLHKEFQAHEKAFKNGIRLYEQGCSAPIDKKTPEWYGWMAAFEPTNRTEYKQGLGTR